MTIYTGAEQVRAVYTALFDRVNETDPDGMDSLVKNKMVIHFRMTEPQIDMWVDGQTKPVQARFSDPGSKTTLAVSMSGDTLHAMLMGTLPLGKAVSSRRLKVNGSLFKAFKLEPLFHTCQAHYPQVARALLA